MPRRHPPTAPSTASTSPAATIGSQERWGVLVYARGGTSWGRSACALAHPSSANARLRFLPGTAPQGAPERYVFGASEIGRLLRLPGKADAGTTAERADS